ncbi:hypothetical protein L2E82_40003 [Cichorium intybus]|uniref:Uncharacterized protein n=1 Tax=Cichorium intybus TaxID=13427 RepID=A0ACB9AJ41_CICIN|nr:hypothetical protein L2E82_40003 [Cichorium intybus]
MSLSVVGPPVALIFNFPHIINIFIEDGDDHEDQPSPRGVLKVLVSSLDSDNHNSLSRGLSPSSTTQGILLNYKHKRGMYTIEYKIQIHVSPLLHHHHHRNQPPPTHSHSKKTPTNTHNHTLSIYHLCVTEASVAGASFSP